MDSFTPLYGTDSGDARLRRDVEELHGRFLHMQRDYTENTRIAEQLGDELERSEREREQLLKQHKALELRYTALMAAVQAQDEKLRMAEGEKQAATEGLRAEAVGLRENVQELSHRAAAAERRVHELEAEAAGLRSELAAKSSEAVHRAEAARSETRMEMRSLIDDRDRNVRQRVDALQTQLREAELHNIELSGRMEKLRESAVVLEQRVAERDAVVARRSHSIETLEAQLAEQRRAAAAVESQLRAELATAAAARESYEKAASAHLSSVQHDAERREHEVAALEERIAALRQQHDRELKRRSDEKDDLERTLTARCQRAGEQLHVAEKAAADRAVELERAQRVVGDLRDECARLKVAQTRAEEEHAAVKRELREQAAGMERVVNETKRHQALLVEREKELALFRAEFERRDWSDRAAESAGLTSRLGEFSSRSASRLNPGNATQAALQPSSPSRIMQRSAKAPGDSSFAPSAGTPPHERAEALAVQLLSDIKQQMGQREATSFTSAANGGSGSGALAQTVAMLSQELANLRMQQEDDRVALERQLAVSQRDADRQRRRAERLLHRASVVASDSPAAIVAPHLPPPGVALADESIHRSADTSAAAGHAPDDVSMQSSEAHWLHRAAPQPSTAAPTPRAPSPTPATDKLRSLRDGLAEPFHPGNRSRH